MEENKMMMTEETTEVRPVENNEVESSGGSSTLAKVVIVGAVGAIAGAAAFGMRKLKARNERKTIEKLRKKGWVIEEPEADEDEDEDIIDGEYSEEDIPEDEE